MIKKTGLFIFSVVLLYALLLIPESNNTDFTQPISTPFEWKRDAYWKTLEEKFNKARFSSSDSLNREITMLIASCNNTLAQLAQDSKFQHNDTRLTQLLDNFFSLGPLVAVTKNHAWYMNFYNRARILIKRQSAFWDINNPEVRASLYSLLYGMRASAEEVLLQSGSQFAPLQFVSGEPSTTPSVTIQEIQVHSGDLLVSRGGAEVSAFISRGNDFPGNFSHVALLYVEEQSNIPYLIEAHIEKGVAIATVEEYLHDTKLRFMVLRPRADLQQLVENPLLPHMAAKFAYDEALKRHIPYDFKMDFYDSSAMFCSEVGSFAYRKNGLELWKAISTISSKGTANWLNTFGVENFVTQMPSDLEYDPQLAVVAEWRDPATLLKDHIDNAVMDALLEKANDGKEIDYTIWMLPVARLVKAYSVLQNLFGKPGTIPEGMSATQALKNNSFVKLYVETKQKTQVKINQFILKNGYTPPYWEMVTLARQSVE